MKTTVEFLDAVKARFGLTTDYQLAKKLGMRQTNISRYYNRGGTMDDAVAMKVAQLLELDPGYVMACIQAERAKDEAVRKVWAKLAKKASGVVAVTLLLLGSGALLTSSGSFNNLQIIASAAASTTGQEYRLCAVLLMLLAALPLCTRHGLRAPHGPLR